MRLGRERPPLLQRRTSTGGWQRGSLTPLDVSVSAADGRADRDTGGTGRRRVQRSEVARAKNITESTQLATTLIGGAVGGEHRSPGRGNTAPKSVFPSSQDIHTQVAYTRKSGVHRGPTFTAIVSDCLEDDEYRALQAGDPEAGDVMPGTGGFRKLRWADRRRGKGKRGGLRVIYYHLSADAQIWLMTLDDKDEMADLSAAEKRALKVALEAELARRAARRRLRRK